MGCSTQARSASSFCVSPPFSIKAIRTGKDAMPKSRGRRRISKWRTSSREAWFSQKVGVASGVQLELF